MPTLPGLTTLDRIKAYLGVALADKSQDPQIDALRTAAEAVIKQRTGRNLVSQTYREFYDGTSTRTLALRQRPVTAVAGVWIDFNGFFGTGTAEGLEGAGFSAFGPSTLQLSGRDYALVLDETPPPLPDGTTLPPWSRSGVLVRINTVWSELGRVYYPGKLSAEVGPALGCVMVDYTAGYPSAAVPEDLQYAVGYLVQYMRRTMPAGAPLHMERIGDYSYELPTLRLPNLLPELATVDQILSRYKESAW